MRSVADVGATDTVATGSTVTSVTATTAVPLIPSLVAVIVTLPAATPVTKPFADTVATPGALLLQLMVRPVSGLPAESLGVAERSAVDPTPRATGFGLIVTEATGAAGTVMTVTTDVSASRCRLSLAITR